MIPEINYKLDTLNFHYGFDCGTGIGIFSINSKESFEESKKIDDLIDFFTLRDFVFKGESLFYSRINNKPLLKIDKYGDLKWIDTNKVLLRDETIKVQFALPYYSVTTGEAKVTYSNEITFNYIDLLEKKVEKY